jgi:phage terminase Nu1 subunit (DNA packaging protein)
MPEPLSIAELKRKYASDPSSLTVAELQQLRKVQTIAQAQKPPPAPLYIVQRRSQVGEFFGVTTDAVDKWVAKGLPVEGRSRYDLSRIAQWYVSRKSQHDDADAAAVAKEKLGLLRERRLATRQERLARSGELVEAETAQARVMSMCADIRSAILELPGQIAPQLVGKSEGEMTAVLDTAVRGALNGLADKWERT